MKHGIIYGGLIGLVFFLLSVSNHYIHADAYKAISTLIFIPAVVLLVVTGLRSIKKTKYAGVINYAQCLFGGFYIAAFAGIACALASLIFLTTIHTNYKEEHLANVKEVLKTQNLPAAEMQAQLKKEEEGQDIRKITGVAFVMFSFLSMIIVIISSAFIRNKDTFNAGQGNIA